MIGQSQRLRLKARWVVPVDGPPLQTGTLEIENGRIAAVHAGQQTGVRDLGSVAILPGLINPHTHLEFSDLRQPLAAGRHFPDWILSTITERQGTDDPLAAIRDGLGQLLEGGCTTCGEIATCEHSLQAFADSQAQGVVYRELIGVSSTGHEQACDVARQHLASQSSSARVKLGLSPHAPYSVHPDLYTRLIDVAVQHRAPVAVHLAESQAELELLENGSGPFVNLLQELGVWRDDVFVSGTRIVDYLQPLDSVERALIIHGNYLDRAAVDFLADRPHLFVVYCPRTHHHFGHSEHPWMGLRRRGVNVVFGTDGRGSNPDLSMWHELQFVAHRHPQAAPLELLRMATLDAARALQMDERVGSLTVGKQADLTVVAVSDGAASPDGDLFNPTHHVVAVMRDGVWVWSALGENGFA